MKKIIWLFVISYSLLVIPSIALAVAPSASQSAGLTQQLLNNLSQQIASRVAELKLVDHRGIIGTVTDVTETQITLSDMQGNTRFIDVDELTKFSAPSAKDNFGISDMQKGQTVGVLGLYNKDSRRLLARFVDVLSLPQFFSGAMLSIDKTHFTVDIVTPDQQTYTIEIEDVTKTSTYTVATGLARSGFSKIATDERVIVVGFPDIKDGKKIIASRIILFPDIPISPRIQTIKLQNNTPPASTGSGKKLVPLTR